MNIINQLIIFNSTQFLFIIDSYIILVNLYCNAPIIELNYQSITDRGSRTPRAVRKRNNTLRSL